MFGLSELAVILIVVIAVLVAKKGPDLARSAGKSARILKAEARAMKDEESAGEGGTTPRVIQGDATSPDNGTPSGSTQPFTPRAHTQEPGPSRPQD